MNQFRIRIEIQLSSLQPTFMLLHCLPVLPADKRPIMFLGEGGIIVSDLNMLYKKVIRRNHLLSIRNTIVFFAPNIYATALCSCFATR
jgi:DNA-directed RNA polymerase subunit beta'